MAKPDMKRTKPRTGQRTRPSRARWLALCIGLFLLLTAATALWHLRPRPAAPEAAQAAEEPGRRVIYPDGAEAKADIAAALAQAGREKKRVLLDFGGNWCGDCQVLAIYFQDAANRDLLAAHYILVPVNIGNYDQNLDIAARYGVPVAKGVPALAVLDAGGKVVYSQRKHEFSAMRTMSSAAVTGFLQEWKG
jgi:thiol:disulfide interchange protein